MTAPLVRRGEHALDDGVEATDVANDLLAGLRELGPQRREVVEDRRGRPAPSASLVIPCSSEASSATTSA